MLSWRPHGVAPRQVQKFRKRTRLGLEAADEALVTNLECVARENLALLVPEIQCAPHARSERDEVLAHECKIRRAKVLHVATQKHVAWVAYDQDDCGVGKDSADHGKTQQIQRILVDEALTGPDVRLGH